MGARVDDARRLERPRVVAIASMQAETPRHATLSFSDDALAAAPAGTFCMVWVPGVDEVPMSLGYNDARGRVTLTVEAKGDCTKALVAMKAGAKIGVRGPYGRGFSWPKKKGRLCFVGGGTGIAPMARGAQQAHAAGHKVTVISGARSRDLLLLTKHLRAMAKAKNIRYEPCTDDGSFGYAGPAPGRLDDLMADEKFDMVYACGPEKMMVKVTEMCDAAGVASEASLERYMKCATGICDACTVGPGLRLCVEGPVLSSRELKTVPEYGAGHRDAAGILHPW